MINCKSRHLIIQYCINKKLKIGNHASDAIYHKIKLHISLLFNNDTIKLIKEKSELFAQRESCRHKLNLALVLTELKRKLYVPLQFWHNRNPDLVLPPIAFQYNNVDIDIDIDFQAYNQEIYLKF